MQSVKKNTNRGRLKYGNPSGDFSKAPRCGAKTRRGTSCLAPAMSNGRCRMHGGKSTGPKTVAGRQRIGAAHFKHGLFTEKHIEERKKFNELMKSYRESLLRLKKKDTKAGGIDISAGCKTSPIRE
jgi:hypothetical protein